VRINLVPTKSGEHGLYVIYRENFDLFAVQLWRLSPKWNLSVERVNEETLKVTDGEMCRVPASHGQWDSYDATRALAWITRTAPNAWLARCNNQACGPSSFNKQRPERLRWRVVRLAITSSAILFASSTSHRAILAWATSHLSVR
jgi:hypothetical protein